MAQGIEVRSHQGLGKMFSLHYIRSKLLAPHHARILSRAQKYREEADYSSEYNFTLADAKEALHDIEQLIAAIAAMLTSHGHLNSP